MSNRHLKYAFCTRCVLCCAAAWLAIDSETAASIAVLTNRTSQSIAIDVRSAGSRVSEVMLLPNELRTFAAEGEVTLRYRIKGQPVARFQLQGEAAYVFRTNDRGQQLFEKIGLVKPPPNNVHLQSRSKPYLLKVKLFVDEEQTAAQSIWEQRLRQRVADASAVLEKTALLRLAVVGTGRWNSDNDESDFMRSFVEFARETEAGPARVAIGFSSQYQDLRRRVHMGGTRGPLDSHILLREGHRQVSEQTRLELLLHELGHFLGAAHSPEANSVMRPVFGGAAARTSSRRMAFDPLNALIMAQTSQELGNRRIESFGDLSAARRRHLISIYRTLLAVNPNDSSAQKMLSRLEPTRQQLSAASTQKVYDRIVQAARINSQRPDDGSLAARLTGDALSTFYIQRAAQAASELPAAQQAGSFLLAVGIALAGAAPAESSAFGPIVTQVISETEHRRAGVEWGSPTLRGRRELAKGFFSAVQLTILAGEGVARQAGLAKEFDAMRDGGEFSFLNLKANEAGIAFAHALSRREIDVVALQRQFSVGHLLPLSGDYEGSYNAQEFAIKFGNRESARMRAELANLRRFVSNMPLYRVER